YSGSSWMPAYSSNGRRQGTWNATAQSGSTGRLSPISSCMVTSSATRGGVKAIQREGSGSSSVTTRRTAVTSSGMESSGTRRFRHDGAGPMSSGLTEPATSPAPPVAYSTRTASEPNEPATAIVMSGLSCTSAGSSYQSVVVDALSWIPSWWLPSTGTREGSRPNGSTA